jgi:phosphatidylserine decarboxylase
MPYDGKLNAMDYIPGDLFSVNQKTVQSVNGLFARNERVVCYFETEFGILSSSNTSMPASKYC